MFGEYINNLIEYIKKTYYFIYNNYNYKQIFLIFAVFITIYIVELLTSYNAPVLQILPMPPGMPPGIQPNNIVKHSLTSKPNMKNNKSNKRTRGNKK
jgi:hypothetical protein